MANETGLITLNGHSYNIDPTSWKEKDMNDFSPRATTPGGSLTMSELMLYQMMWQNDYRHGFGWMWYTDSMGYMKTEGNIDTRHEGVVMMYTQSVSSDTNNNIKDGLVIFNGSVYTYGAAGLRKFSGGSWSSVYSTAAVNWAIATKNYLLFCPDGLRVQKLSTADAVTDAGVNSSTADFAQLIVFNGYIYGFVDGTNQVHYSDKEDLSTLEGLTTDTNITYVGASGVEITGLIVYAGSLYAGTSTGLYRLSDDRATWIRVLDYESEASSLNFRGMVVYNGTLVYSIRNKIFSWNGARYVDITPQRLTDTFPYVTYGNYKCFVEADGYLYCIGRTNESTYYEALLCYDGVAWFKLSDLVTNGSNSVTMLGVDTVNSRLWYHVDAASDVTYYISQQTGSDFPYANFPTTGTHALYSARMDMGFRRVYKSSPTLDIQASNVTAARTIAVYYSLDGGAWTLWSTITSPGVTTLSMPNSLRTVEYRWIQFKLVFVTDSSAQSPVYEGMTLRLLMRPDEFYGCAFAVYVDSNHVTMDGEDTRSSKDIVTDLKTARDSKSPIELVDMLGISHWGYITSLQFTGLEYHNDDMYVSAPNVEMVAQVNFSEVA